ncbi:hypothetical protein [Algoriphagus sp. D3-2-R+10]|uniref:hypothetical protein n=1 Tax=Algoriphagus aurantiacus TaxID=3103948 RepID=UPI002B4071E2|nr:hypothetical protein [Algoriphagus sp. D3-2-R+10]
MTAGNERANWILPAVFLEAKTALLYPVQVFRLGPISLESPDFPTKTLINPHGDESVYLIQLLEKQDNIGV